MSSQYDEDNIIRAFFGDFTGSFLDIGAGDGKLGSNTYELSKRGWKGWCVEPHPEAFSELRKLYRGSKRVYLIHGAVSSDGKMIRFFYHDGQLSTGVQCFSPSVSEFYYVPSLTPAQIARMAGDSFDFVSLDCEGMDQEIANSCHALFRHTKLFCYEHNPPCRPADDNYTAKWLQILSALNFTKVVGRTEGNTLVARA